MEGIPKKLVEVTNEQQDVTKENPKRTSPHKGSIIVTISIREGLYMTEKRIELQQFRETGGLILNRLNNFYYLPEFHDMRWHSVYGK